MYLAWVKHLKDKEKQDSFKKDILSAKSVLERMRDLLEEEKNNIDRSETDIKSFDQPNWHYKQAYKNGYRACLQFLEKLTNLDQQEHNTTDDQSIRPNK